jgi:uncharacterized protein YukE
MAGVTGDQQELKIPAMSKLASDYTANATKCKEIADFLRSPMATMYWRSQAATAFEGDINNYVKALNGFKTAFEGLATEVRNRISDLETSKNTG